MIIRTDIQENIAEVKDYLAQLSRSVANLDFATTSNTLPLSAFAGSAADDAQAVRDSLVRLQVLLRQWAHEVEAA